MDSPLLNKLPIEFVDRVAKICGELFSSLPKTGKPTKDEWTVLSCIVQHNKLSNTLDVVSLGTGSKCIGASKMSCNGDLLNDSHAEIFARRGFILYLYNSILNKSSIFTKHNNKFQLNENIDFIFYSSQLPCGDASIVPKIGEVEDYGKILICHKRKSMQLFDTDIKKEKVKVVDSNINILGTMTNTQKIGNSKQERLSADNTAGPLDLEFKTEHLNTEVVSNNFKNIDLKQFLNTKPIDIHRTGAKCLPNSFQDPKEIGLNYHILGQVRTKPGRGDRTLSVSCSDKMARWAYLGIQGALLDMLIENPVYIKHYIFGAGVPYSEESLQRALLYRQIDNELLKLPLVPYFYQSSHAFDCRKNKERSRPAPCSIVWVKRNEECIQVAVQGRRLGTTKKNMNSTRINLCISKYELYKKFIEILNLNDDLKNSIVKKCNSIPYNVMKQKSTRYLKNWENIRQNYFQVYTKKPDMWNFTLE